MENQEKYQSSDAVDLISNYNEAIELAEEKIKKENWRPNFTLSDTMYDVNQSQIEDLSLNQRKKLRNKIKKVIYKPGLRNINSLLWFVSKIVLSLPKIWNVKISEKEERIQLARKKWKVARDVSDQLLAKYKEEKGNFYKKP